jgi:uncharacterized protein (TIGR02300 family)
MGGRSTPEVRTNVTKAELGTKRICPNCGTKYYDLNRSPIICPKCGTVFALVAAASAAKARAQAAAKAPVEEEEVEAVPEKDAELVSLEEADDEAADSGAVKVEGVEDEHEAVEGDDADDDTFLADEEEEEEDVGDIIGDVDEEER